VSLNPQFEIIFSDEKIAVLESVAELKIIFERIEKGAASQLEKFMRSEQLKYEVGMLDFVTKPCHSWTEFMSPEIVKSAFKLDLLTNFRSYVARYFKSAKLMSLMEFPVIFLGAFPKNIPELYSLMNYGDYALGTYYPLGGFYQLVLAMKNVAGKQGTNFHFNKTVGRAHIQNHKVTALTINDEKNAFDTVVASSDYHHTETLLDKEDRNYDEAYWKKKTFAPSSLIFYLGID
jgi:phytoene desaturase